MLSEKGKKRLAKEWLLFLGVGMLPWFARGDSFHFGYGLDYQAKPGVFKIWRILPIVGQRLT